MTSQAIGVLDHAPAFNSRRVGTGGKVEFQVCLRAPRGRDSVQRGQDRRYVELGRSLSPRSAVVNVPGDGKQGQLSQQGVAVLNRCPDQGH